MATHNKTYQPLQSLTVKAAADLPPFRFVAIDGSLCGNETRALGVTEIEWLEDEYAAVVSLGTIVIETSEAILAGADVTSAADGKAKTAVAGNPVNGRALEGCSGAGFIKIKLVP
jgi:hypothetical protein